MISLTRQQADSAQRQTKRLQILDARAALSNWRDELRRVPAESDDELLERMADAMGPLYEFFADAQNPRSMGIRAWCLVYAIRPDLIGHQTIQSGAEFFGVTQEAVCYQLKQLEASFPGFKYVRRGLPHFEKLRHRMRSMTQKSVEARRPIEPVCVATLAEGRT